MFKIDNDNESIFSTEFLIINEDSIDWQTISRFSNRSFSLPEIRMFRNKINWTTYLLTHYMERDIDIEKAAKYFSENDFKLLSRQKLSKEIISLFADRLCWKSLIESAIDDEDFLFEKIEHWKNISVNELTSIIDRNPMIDLKNSNFNKLSLYLKLKD